MDGLTFERDIRNTEPDETPYRKARFKVGWGEAVAGKAYTLETLADLTWQNLGYRLGRLFGPTPPELQDDMYDICVRIQAQRPR